MKNSIIFRREVSIFFLEYIKGKFYIFRTFATTIIYRNSSIILDNALGSQFTNYEYIRLIVP
jgi:hypothetical protein